MMELLRSLKHYLFTPEGLQEMIQTWGYAALFAIIFVETGAFIFFLPGDSLLFIAGFMAGVGTLNFWLLNLLLIAAAIMGDTLGYWIGAKSGQALFKREDGLIFKRKHLLATQAFYDKHGGKTIILARFVPIIRTFAPVVAGVGGMKYRKFISYNIFGGIGWIFSMTTLGYFLGKIDWVKHNLEKAVLLVIFISILPGIIEFMKHRRKPAIVAIPAPEEEGVGLE